MAIELLERQIEIAADDAATAEARDQLRQELERDGWIYSYQKPAVTPDGDPLAAAVVLCFWRRDDGTASPSADRASDALATTPERPENWTKA